MRPVELDIPEEYIPECDRRLPPEEQSVMLYEPMTHAQIRAFINAATKKGGKGTAAEILGAAPADTMHEIVAAKLRGFRNFKRADGSDVPFEQVNGSAKFIGESIPVASSETMDFVPPRVVQELFNHIMSAAVPTDEDVGKSPSLVSSRSTG